MTRLRFRHIEVFRAVIYTGTVTGAAAMLHVTQPAVSQLLAEIEDLVGVTLFDRKGGRVVPTLHADHLFAEVERCFLGLEHVNAFCDRLRDGVRRSVVVMSVPSVALTLLPLSMAEYVRGVAPDVFSVHAQISELAIGAVSSQKADLGFGSNHGAMPGIQCEPITTLPALCAVPPGSPLAAKRVVRVADLQDVNFITVSRTEGLHERLEDALAAAGVSVRIVAECPMASAACAMVDAGIGVTLVDHLAGYHFLRRGPVLRRFEPAIPVTFYAYWAKARRPLYKRTEFLDILRRHAAAIEAAVTEHLEQA